ncbi:hypothetical protein ETD86_41150 [Nonomuraea turkmeniaca]|uniref:DUF5655 domain-containing protein n=1 Tax=Nonomuraea turkmeniaca TaxID=103838 RepID=A0A5S4FLL4_9ACTN|nr:hypothetical protein [Nonomuraea turkmeniaca]TMR10026.1 hypothetical protein ETD86_41150 [Nonomuraea turkmeniaca]
MTAAGRWTCPQCDREFARARQSHVCVPGCTVDETFAPYPPVYREIYDRLVERLGPIHDDAVRVGVFLKSERKFAEVRPKARSLSLAPARECRRLEERRERSDQSGGRRRHLATEPASRSEAMSTGRAPADCQGAPPAGRAHDAFLQAQPRGRRGRADPRVDDGGV